MRGRWQPIYAVSFRRGEGRGTGDGGRGTGDEGRDARCEARGKSSWGLILPVLVMKGKIKLLTAYRLLPTDLCLPPTAYRPLPTAHCLPPTAYRLLPPKVPAPAR